jgi:hypothetical protein
MSDTMNEETDYEMLETEISDESLEAAALAEKFGGAYTYFFFCTQLSCPS